MKKVGGVSSCGFSLSFFFYCGLFSLCLSCSCSLVLLALDSFALIEGERAEDGVLAWTFFACSFCKDGVMGFAFAEQ